MRKCEIKTPEQALLYLTDCQLATVVSMCQKKSRGSGEFLRQKSIAQISCDWIKTFKIPIDTSNRIKDVIECGSVEQWTKNFDVKLQKLS